jgi:hypothetical protein
MLILGRSGRTIAGGERGRLSSSTLADGRPGAGRCTEPGCEVETGHVPPHSRRWVRQA